ncbi:PLD nuclease N-terminal domain-containing protein [Streptomonospora wellingtoniae]|uniref:PLD nuclease N-terminal domain-containing protein n=1 Tax=Streptomonospora wellingtoniae TaxID=3075544 RepID=A0ABU2KMQ8_9ACTN|nr:PLD nuclease N-terminal domain-containing protein [Streptomonospora sp. DSM 45055]MDT0300540.1 PLD nuclease N-terminal domain-containing protein [Streptomonospora sp. DSM 45055]
MVWLAGLITLLTIVVWVYAFFDALTSPAAGVRNLPKILWLIIIALFTPVGPLLWLFLGRPREPDAPEPAAPTAQTASLDHLDPSDFNQASDRDRPLGPDDDPEFLRKLNRRIDPEE